MGPPWPYGMRGLTPTTVSVVSSGVCSQQHEGRLRGDARPHRREGGLRVETQHVCVWRVGSARIEPSC